jgi:hypothetical protein
MRLDLHLPEMYTVAELRDRVTKTAGGGKIMGYGGWGSRAVT